MIEDWGKTVTELHNILMLTGDGDFDEVIEDVEEDGHNVMVVHAGESIAERFSEERQIRTFLGLRRKAEKNVKQRRREWYISKMKGAKSAREAVTPLADMSYADQLEQKKASIMQMLERLVRNFLILSLFHIFEIAFSSLTQLQRSELFDNVFDSQTGNEHKASPNGKSLPELVLRSREIGKNTIQSPMLLISVLTGLVF